MSLYGPKQLAGSMRTVRKNTILIAEDIPEKDYGYRPVPESRSVTETLVHIVFRSQLDRYLHEEKHLSSLEGFDFGALFQKSKLEERARSQDQIVDLLRTEGERWSRGVKVLAHAVLAEDMRMAGGASPIRVEGLRWTN